MKNPEVIQIRGAKTHNLKNINLDIKMNKITCIAGPSGSGKSSIAFHTLLVESKRRFINSLPTDMKFFWEIPHTVEVDTIYPVLPAWGLPQYNPVQNSRPVALDVLGGHERLQKIYMELGRFVCPVHHLPFEKILAIDAAIAKIGQNTQEQEGEIFHLFCTPDVYRRFVSPEMSPTRSYGSSIKEFNEADPWYELFRVKARDLSVISKKLHEFDLPKNSELLLVALNSKKQWRLSHAIKLQCPVCDQVEDEDKVQYIESLSPLNAMGACPECEGHGMILVFDREKLVKDPTKSIREGAINFLMFSHFLPDFPKFLRECKKRGIDVNVPFKELPSSIWKFLYTGGGSFEGLNAYFDYLKSQRYKKNIRIYVRSMQSEVLCGACEGTRISQKAAGLSLVLPDENITYKGFLRLTFKEGHEFLKKIKQHLRLVLVHEKLISTFEKLERLYCVAVDIGLGHIRNTRKVRSMSSSEYQRLLLAKYLSYEGSQSLFVLDEPSLGLSLSCQKKLMEYLCQLRDQGNTVLLVEHSEFLKSSADEIILMGPGAGNRGGEVLYQGKYQKEHQEIPPMEVIAPPKKEMLELKGATIREMYKEDLVLQKRAVNWIYGESGTGKSSVVVNVIANEIHKHVYGSRLSFDQYSFKKLKGIDDFLDVVVINSSIDKISSRSTVGTFTDLGGFVRKYFASLPISKSLDLKEGHFSANSELGQCQTCEGRGVKLVEMHFMEDVEFVCDDCQGKKIKPYYANISDGHMTVHEAFTLPLSEVLSNMRLTPKGKRIWEYFKLLKLDYLSLDRTLMSLSGGERQRLQLLSLLDRKMESAFIVFENLSSGLSLHELAPLAQLLHQLSGSGHTLAVIDQNTFFSKISHHQVEFKF